MTIEEFESYPKDQVAEVWKTAFNGVLLEGKVENIFLRVSKADLGYNLLAAIEHPYARGLSCDCPLSDQKHAHYDTSIKKSQEAVEHITLAIEQIKNGNEDLRFFGSITIK
jgi:hypothetical protein